jgi:hypothetical protein
MPKFKIGDLVRLKGQIVELTVVEPEIDNANRVAHYNPGTVAVCWFLTTGELQRAHVSEAALDYLDELVDGRCGLCRRVAPRRE